jgi:hypothetical protein
MGIITMCYLQRRPTGTAISTCPHWVVNACNDTIAEGTICRGPGADRKTMERGTLNSTTMGGLCAYTSAALPP